MSVLNLDSVSSEGRIGIIRSFVHVSMYVLQDVALSRLRESVRLTFHHLLDKALGGTSRKENLNALHF